MRKLNHYLNKAKGLVVKWISHVSSEHGFGVRIPTRPPKKIMSITTYRKSKKTDTEPFIS